jgi:hypothetical protein
MSAERTSVTEPGEQVYLPRASWAPVFFAFAAALALAGIYVEDSFMLPGWVYSLIGIVLMLAALRSMISEARRGYYRLPRRQRSRGAVLPVEKITPPRAD